MSTAPKKRYTPEEYLALVAKSDQKYEYYDGEIFAMSGGKKEHARINGNLYFALRAKLEGQPCEPFTSDQAVKVSATALCTFPDGAIACDAEFEAGPIDVLLNPCIVFEVLSSTTERHDRTFKLRHYQQIDSVREIVFVTQEAPYIERFVRGGDAIWQFSQVFGLESTLKIDAVGCEISLADIYRGVEFPPQEDPLQRKNA